MNNPMMDEIVDYNNRSRFFASQLIPGSVKQRAGIYFCYMATQWAVKLLFEFKFESEDTDNDLEFEIELIVADDFDDALRLFKIRHEETGLIYKIKYKGVVIMSPLSPVELLR